MRTIIADTEDINVVEEPQLAVKVYPKIKNEQKKQKGKSTLNMLSLFSGCGGMDLGFEGDFSVCKRIFESSFHIRRT